jgi:hypothetical protein
MMNGGDEGWVNQLFREYFGLSRVVYLEPLPKPAIPHVDMFFRPVDPTTFLLAEYPKDLPASSPFFDLVHRETRATLERNAEILRKEFPSRRIVRVPLPPLRWQADRDAMERSSRMVLVDAGVSYGDLTDEQVIARALAITAERLTRDDADRPAAHSPAAVMMHQVRAWRDREGIKVPDELALIREIDETGRKIDSLQKRVELQKKSGPPDRRDADDLLRYKERYDKAAFNYVLAVTLNRSYYMTYLNALHLKGARKEAVIVPSYKEHRRQEPAVREQFRKAYPNAEVVFVPADLLVS